MERKAIMKARNLFIACSSVVATVIASTSFAWGALSCDYSYGDAGDSPASCRRYSDNAVLGTGTVDIITNRPRVTRLGQGRDLTVYGFDENYDYIDDCYAQTILNVTDVTVIGNACEEDVFYFSINGKDIYTP